MPEARTDRRFEVADAVDEERLWRRHVAMAAIGGLGDGGVNRQALTPQDIEARKLLISWAEERGFEVSVDAIANLFIRRPGIDPRAAPVLTGSHMDSQPAGGRFDGIYGVLAGLEALQALEDSGIETPRPVVVVAWTNEEGSRFAPGAMGSMVFAGHRRLEELLEVRDAQGITLRDALAETLAATPNLARWPCNMPIATYVEAHIEQGPVLERNGRPIGVVTGIQGSRWFEVRIDGVAAHAGTAPLRERKDAVQGAIRAIQTLNELMHDPDDVVRFTVGRIEVTPNSPNTVAERAAFTIDLRHPDAATLRRLGDAVPAACEAAKPCTARLIETSNNPPIDFSARVIEVIENAAAELGLPALQLPSGAFHDAQHLAPLCPTGMIFVPCKGGVSHSPAEYASPEALAAGTRVLAAALTVLAKTNGKG